MAGGWGVGKTHALEHAEHRDLAWDGTLKDTAWARAMFDHALAHGWRVEIACAFRDIELALYGAVERAKTEGRSVPLSELPGFGGGIARRCEVQNDSPDPFPDQGGGTYHRYRFASAERALDARRFGQTVTVLANSVACQSSQTPRAPVFFHHPPMSLQLLSIATLRLGPAAAAVWLATCATGHALTYHISYLEDEGKRA